MARGALSEGYSPEVPGRMLTTLSHFAYPTQRDQVLNVLRLLDTKVGALTLTGKPVPVSWLTANEAEALLTKWKASKLAMHRQLARVLIPLALASLYAYQGKEWERIGYPGPLGPPPDEPKRLDPIQIDRDEEMNCDVVIVGSGAGGGCVAAGLAAAGLDVIVVEKGSYRSESDFHHREPEAMHEMYLYGLTLMTSDLGCRIVA